MHSKSEYYWAYDETVSYGDLWFLKSPQAIDSTGGGQLLLGSVLERVKVDGFMCFNHFPRPQMFVAQRQPIINAVIQKLDLTPGEAADLVKSLAIVNPIETESNSISADFKGQSGQIPGISLPLNLGASFDLSKVDALKMSLPSANLMYVPLQCLRDLFVACQGKAEQLGLGAGIDQQYLCDAILVASDYSVVVTHHLDNHGDFSAEIAAARIYAKFAKTSDTSFTLTISTKPFVVALSTRRWCDLDPR